MSRINFDALPISADQARAARNYFAWSQVKAAEASGLPLNTIKRLETGNYVPDEGFLSKLRAFYERSGYPFDDTPKPGAGAVKAGQVFPAGVVAAAANGTGAQTPGRPTLTAFHHIRIAITDEREMGELLDMIDANEDKASAILRQPVEEGFFGGINEATERRHAQIVRILSDNGTMFAKLFGRDIGGKPTADVLKGTKKPATGADLLHKVQADIHLASSGNADAKARQKDMKANAAAGSILQAIGLS